MSGKHRGGPKMRGQMPALVIYDELVSEQQEQAGFTKETEDDKAQRIYRETHDSRGHYFNNPNRAQRRHIAASWKNKGKR